MTSVIKILVNSSGQGAIPYWRYSPRPGVSQLNRCNSDTNSIVWMREEYADGFNHKLSDIRFCISTLRIFSGFFFIDKRYSYEIKMLHDECVLTYDMFIVYRIVFVCYKVIK